MTRHMLWLAINIYFAKKFVMNWRDAHRSEDIFIQLMLKEQRRIPLPTGNTGKRCSKRTVPPSQCVRY